MNFLGGIWNMMEARRRRRNIETAAFFGVGCGAFLICGIIAIIVGSIMNAVETGAVRSAYGASYAEACDGMPSGSESLDTLDKGDTTPRQVLILTGDTQRRDDFHAEMPSQWRAEDEDSVSLIACVERESEVIETCAYERPSDEGSYTVDVDREEHSVTVVLINPDTGRLIDSMTVDSDEPDDCPDDYDDVPTGNTISADDDVEWDDFASWIEDYVFDD